MSFVGDYCGRMVVWTSFFTLIERQNNSEIHSVSPWAKGVKCVCVWVNDVTVIMITFSHSRYLCCLLPSFSKHFVF